MLAVSLLKTLNPRETPGFSLAFRVLSKDSGSCRLIDGSNAPSQGADATSARRTLSVSWLKISAKN